MGLSEYWAQKKAANQAAQARGDIVTKVVKDRIQVTAPYSKAFIDGAHNIGGRWRPKSGVWSFPFRVRAELLGLLTQVYGRTK